MNTSKFNVNDFQSDRTGCCRIHAHIFFKSVHSTVTPKGVCEYISVTCLDLLRKIDREKSVTYFKRLRPTRACNILSLLVGNMIF